jgi:methylated-DNA-[protein]-cysteine S-methyltransferase
MSKRNDRPYYAKAIPTPVGRLMLVCSDDAISALLWENESRERVPLPWRVDQVTAHPLLDKTQSQLEEYFSGKRRAFDLPLAPEGTPFQQQVWQALLRIPYGRTISYQEQAMQTGGARKTRAVGAANGKNPISIIIPCHRVIGKNGSLTGFAGGLELKRYLLQLEARHVDPEARQETAYGLPLAFV